MRKNINVIRKPNKTIVVYYSGKPYAKVNINPKIEKPKAKVSFKDTMFAGCVCLMLLFLVGVITYGVITGKGSQVKVAEAKEVKQSIMVIEKEKKEVIPPILRRIAKAESGDRHFDSKGNVIRGKVVNSDIGRYQINEKIWGKKAKELGYDIFSEKGNEQMAVWIFNNQGSVPWRASSSGANGWLRK